MKKLICLCVAVPLGGPCRPYSVLSRRRLEGDLERLELDALEFAEPIVEVLVVLVVFDVDVGDVLCDLA